MLFRRKNQFENVTRKQTNSSAFQQNRLFQQVQDTETLPSDVVKIRNEIDQYCFQLLKGIQNNYPSDQIIKICEKIVLFLRLSDADFLRELAQIFQSQGDVGLFIDTLHAHRGNQEIEGKVAWILLQIFQDQKCNACFAEHPFFEAFAEILADDGSCVEVRRNVG